MTRPKVQRLETRPNADGEFLTVEIREIADGTQTVTLEHRWRDLEKPTSRDKLIGASIRLELLP